MIPIETVGLYCQEHLWMSCTQHLACICLQMLYVLLL